MAKFVFSKILSASGKAGTRAMDTYEAQNWFRRRVSASKIRPKNITTAPRAENQKLIRNEMVGNLYFFKYDPTTKAKLAHWDSFPLVLVIETIPKGILGINFHYLSHQDRAVLMDHLLELEEERINPQGSVLNKRKITYEKLASSSRYKYFRPALKAYHFTGISSKMVALKRAEWNLALFLPAERFQKTRKQKVWAESHKYAIRHK